MRIQLFPGICMLLALVIAPGVLAKDKVSPEQVNGATTVDTEMAKALFDEGAVFLDVRSDRDWEAGRIPGSHHLELKAKFNQNTLAEIAQKHQKLVIYCNSIGCMRSSKASAKAVSWGYRNVYYYRMGYPGWHVNGYAIE